MSSEEEQTTTEEEESTEEESEEEESEEEEEEDAKKEDEDSGEEEESDEEKPARKKKKKGKKSKKPKYPEGPETEPIRSPDLKPEDDLVSHLYPAKWTLTENFEHCVEKYGDQILYKWRPLIKTHTTLDLKSERSLITREHGPVETLTFNQVNNMVRAFASGVKQFSPELKKGSLAGVYLDTCKEWIISAHGLMLQGITCVTVYANLGFDALVKCINECQLTTLICDAGNIKNIDRHLGGGACPSLERLVVVGNVTCISKEFQMKTFYQVCVDGFQKKMKKFNRPAASDLAFIMYTSGTTGDPKGVMMSHQNIVASIGAIKVHIDVVKEDRYFSYLPLAHVFELVVHHLFLCCGAEICFGNPRSLIAKPGGAKHIGDLDLYKCTVMAGVPRVFDTIMKGVLAKVRAKGGVAYKIFHSALESKKKGLLKGKQKGARGAKIAFGKVRKMMGGNFRLIVCGGAALSSESQLFLQSILGRKTTVIQGYGLTETCSALTCQVVPNTNCFRTGTVGYAFKCGEMKLVDVPEMGYYANPKEDEDGKLPLRRGEICTRGPHVTMGYYKKPDKTEEVYKPSKDGSPFKWFHTGDVGQINEDGTLSIIDRKKNLVKLPHGEYVALENLEMMYGTSNFVFPNGVCVVADPTENDLVALMHADPAYAKSWGEEMNLRLDEILAKPEFKEAVLDDFKVIHKKKGKKGFELVKNVHICHSSDEWTPENGMLTASSKLKRRDIERGYAEQIQTLFGALKAKKGGKGKKKKKKEEKKEKKKKKGKEIPQFIVDQFKPYHIEE